MHYDLLACQNVGWQGVTLNITCGHFHRAALEGLTEQPQRNLQTLEKIGRSQVTELLLIGGDSCNILWNQAKANVPGIPVKVLGDAETTVAGTTMSAQLGIGKFIPPEQTCEQVRYQYCYFYP